MSRTNTRQIAKNLLGVKVIYQDTTQTYTGYIVETEAYLGLNDRAAHGYPSDFVTKLMSKCVCMTCA
jgi:DNA-3-methyladenine glycosylase